VILVPLFMGGRHPLGHLVLCTLATVGALAWAIRELTSGKRGWRCSGAEMILVLAALLGIAQLAPLPASVLRWASPKIEELLILWHEPTDDSPGLGRWSCISLAPEETRCGLAIFGACVTLFLLAIQRIENLDDLRRILRLVAYAGAGMAALGLIQYASGTEKFFGFYEHPFRKASQYVTGSFSTKNHFGHFLALTLGSAIFWLVASSEAEKRRSSATFSGRRASAFWYQPYNRVWPFCGLVLIIVAVLACLSRGAILAAIAACAVMGLASLRAGLLKRPVLWAGVPVVLIVAVFFVAKEFPAVSERLRTLTGGPLEEIDQYGVRRMVWQTVLRAIPDFAALGAGIGVHQEIFPTYLESKNFPRYFTHAESGYLQVALETGFPGLVLLFAGIGLWAAWSYKGITRGRGAELQLTAGAAGAALAASVTQSFADFVWYVPGCLSLTAILGACACRAAQLSEELPTRQAPAVTLLTRGSVVSISLIWIAGCGWMIATAWGPAWAAPFWESYLIRQARTACNFQQDTPLANASAGTPSADAASPEETILSLEPSAIVEPTAITKELVTEEKPGTPPGEGYLRSSESGWEQSSGTSEPVDYPDRVTEAKKPLRSHAEANEQETIMLLERVVYHHGGHARAHCALAAAYLRLFELRQQNSEAPLPLSQIRDAALTGGFTDFESRNQWLNRVLEARRAYLESARKHALLALRSCPLLGEAYLILAQLNFLTNEPQPTPAQFVTQSVQVRPRDGWVLFQAGSESVLAGHFHRGLEFWRQAFQCGPVYQENILRRLMGRILPREPAAELHWLTEVFQPGLVGLRLLHNHYEPFLSVADIAPIRQEIARKAEQETGRASSEEAAELWLVAMEMYEKLGDHKSRIRAGEQAFLADPNSYRVRYFLGDALSDAGQYDQAIQHFRWCLNRRPDHAGLKRKVNWLQEQLQVAPSLSPGRSFTR